jgi:hypothetical protein
MREMSVTEQKYKAVLAVIADGRTVGSAVASAPDYLDRAAVRPLSSCSPVIDWS